MPPVVATFSRYAVITTLFDSNVFARSRKALKFARNGTYGYLVIIGACFLYEGTTFATIRNFHVANIVIHTFKRDGETKRIQNPKD